MRAYILAGLGMLLPVIAAGCAEEMGRERAAGADIIGVVRDAEGKPIPGAAVACWKKAATTDSQGRFVVYSPQVIGEGVTHLCVSAKGFIPAEIREVRTGNTTESIVLERQYELVIRAQTPQGRSVDDFEVHVEQPQLQSVLAAHSARQLEAGQVRMIFHTPGKRTLWIIAKGYAMTEVPVEVVRNAGPVTVRLSKGVAVTGKANVADGGYTGGKVLLRPGNRWVVPSITVPLGADGSYRFEHVGPGQYDLTAQVPGKTDAKTSFKVADADVNLPELKIRGTGTVIGQVFGYIGGSELRNGHGAILSEDGKRFEFQTDKDGRFRVDGVTLGKARVSAGWSEGCLYHSMEANVQVLEGKTQEVIVTSEAATQPATNLAD